MAGMKGSGGGKGVTGAGFVKGKAMGKDKGFVATPALKMGGKGMKKGR